MTTDELRAWMKALEERDMRIVALEKQVQVLVSWMQLRDAEQKPVDAHAQAASEIFGVPPEQVTPLQRANAKALTFGERMLVGGMKRAAQTCSDCESSVEQAKDERLEKANAAAAHHGWSSIWQYAAMRKASSGAALAEGVHAALAYVQEHGLPLDANLAADIRRRGWLR